MSFNRENVIWQSADGTWNRGFFEIAWQGEGDPEWDVEYGSGFSWVRTGLASEDAACEAWTGANPGGYWSVAYSPESAEECASYDERAKAALAEEADRLARERAVYRPPRRW